MTSFQDQDEKYPLPEEIVHLLFDGVDPTVKYLSKVLELNKSQKPKYRKELQKLGIIKKLSPIKNKIKFRAIDGSYSLKSAVGTDLAVIAAASVGYKNKIAFKKIVQPFPRLERSEPVLRGLMTILEIKLLAKEEKTPKILDGSYISLLTSLNQFLTILIQYGEKSELWKRIVPQINSFLNASDFSSFLKRGNTIASPKHVIANKFLPKHFPQLLNLMDDRTFFTMMLNLNEYTIPIPEDPQTLSASHLPKLTGIYNDAKQIEKIYKSGFYKIIYFKPQPWSSAYKIEIPNAIINKGKLEEYLSAYKSELIDPSINEPYLQFFADKIVKQSVIAADAVFEAAFHALHEKGFSAEDIAQYLKPYRTGV